MEWVGKMKIRGRDGVSKEEPHAWRKEASEREEEETKKKDEEEKVESPSGFWAPLWRSDHDFVHAKALTGPRGPHRGVRNL